MSENGTLEKLKASLLKFAHAKLAHKAAKRAKAAVVSAYQDVWDKAKAASSNERDARADVVSVQVEEAREKGFFEESTRLRIPGIGWVQSVPQPPEIVVADIPAFLDAIAENKMIRDMLIIDIGIKQGVAQQLLGSNDGRFPGLKCRPQPDRVSVSVKEYEDFMEKNNDQ